MPPRLAFESVAMPLAFVLAVPTGLPLRVKLTVFPLTGEPFAVSTAERVVVPPYVPPAADEERAVSDMALWVIVTACPATVIVRFRGPKDDDLDATEYVTKPLPLPVAPEVIVIQLALLTAVQLQLPVVITATVAVPPL